MKITQNKNGTYRNDTDEGGLARVLKANQGELEFLLPEQASQPVKQSLESFGNWVRHFAAFSLRSSLSSMETGLEQCLALTATHKHMTS